MGLCINNTWKKGLKGTLALVYTFEESDISPFEAMTSLLRLPIQALGGPVWLS